jgi:hypothetical protein
MNPASCATAKLVDRDVCGIGADAAQARTDLNADIAGMIQPSARGVHATTRDDAAPLACHL